MFISDGTSATFYVQLRCKPDDDVAGENIRPSSDEKDGSNPWLISRQYAEASDRINQRYGVRAEKGATYWPLWLGYKSVLWDHFDIAYTVWS